MIDTPKIAQAAAQQTAFIHLIVPRAEIQNVMGPGITEIFSALAAQGVAPAGPWFTHHRRVPTETFDFEICVPITTPVTAVGRVQPGQLPAAIVARTIYHGAYEGLAAGWGELMSWIKDGGHTPATDLWECYVTGPESESDSSNYRTELNRPLILQT